jgi:uncharacterized protein (DUF1697 family)
MVYFNDTVSHTVQTYRQKSTCMYTFISLLRGINVSGQNKITMADLRALYESLGFMGVESYVQSGNVLFDCDEGNRTLLAGMIESYIQRYYGYNVATFIRDMKKSFSAAKTAMGRQNYQTTFLRKNLESGRQQETGKRSVLCTTC